MASEAEDVAWLERGWDWLAGNAGHPRHDEFEAEWIKRLGWYEQAMRLTGRA